MIEIISKVLERVLTLPKDLSIPPDDLYTFQQNGGGKMKAGREFLANLILKEFEKEHIILYTDLEAKRAADKAKEEADKAKEEEDNKNDKRTENDS